MWLVVSTVLALIAGHMALLSRFPPVSMSAQKRFLFASGSVRATEAFWEVARAGAEDARAFGWLGARPLGAEPWPT